MVRITLQDEEDEVQECLKTRFFVPEWWVQGLEGCLAINKQKFSWDKTLKVMLSPAFTFQELYIFPLLMAKIQSQLFLAKAPYRLQMSPAELDKESGFYLNTKKKVLGKILCSLGSLKIHLNRGNKNLAIS